MRTLSLGIAPFLVFASVLVADQPVLFGQSQTSGTNTPDTVLGDHPESASLVDQYCLRCHNDRALRGNLSLASFDVTSPEKNAEVAEKMIRKLTAGMMPPPGSRRPDDDQILALIDTMVQQIDEVAAVQPNPGRRTFQRLNRAEYARAVRDLLTIDVDVNAFLPPDTMSQGFDNIADVQNLSATLLEGYLRAADHVSRLAVGDTEASASESTYRVPRTASQLRRVDGAPFGTRGGVAVIHNFPADGDYTFEVKLHVDAVGVLFGRESLHLFETTAQHEGQIEISVDGERVALLAIDPFMHEADPNGVAMETEPVAIKAGPRRVAAAFLKRFEGPVDDLMGPNEHSLADTDIGTARGITTVPHLRHFNISGPYNVTGVSDTPSRRAIFTCRPVSADEEGPCAQAIVSRLAERAYRRPVDNVDLEGLMRFFERGRSTGDFEGGIRTALQALLANPQFVFRFERLPATEPTERFYQINHIELASRLSFFLWGSVPDEELIDQAIQGAFADPAKLEHQVRRMLEDPRAEAFGTRFAAQYLRLQDLEKLHPDAVSYPYYDQTLARSLRRETELFFEYLVRDDRSVLDLLDADYSFVDERVAKHYGIPNITGTRFQRVSLPDERRGILGHGSILASTSLGNRTSPVLRGKWVMEVLLGSPPPPPPANVPELEETNSVSGERRLSVRERMEEHRSNPACSSCHRVIDPLGLALENYDVTGAWRIKDSGIPIDPSGDLYDGTPLNGPADLRKALLNRSQTFLTSFTENLMAYALGRRIEYYDQPTIRKVMQNAAQKDNKMSAFILGIINSAPFQMTQTDDVVFTEDEASSAGSDSGQH
jgi:hypothetical protein